MERNRVLSLLAGVGLFVAASGATAAQEAAGSLSGTMVGDRGGAYQTWNVTLPADTQVTLTLEHWPCDTGSAVGINVWGASGRVARSSAAGSCMQRASFNSGTGGAAEIQVYNYLHGLGTWWSLATEGISLSAPAPAAPAAVVAEAPAATAAEAPAAEPAAPVAAPAPVAVAVTGTSLSATDTVFGDRAGAFDSYNLTVSEGQSVTIRMTVGTDAGGTWHGLGFDVWGPNGRVARGSWTSPTTVEATFASPGDVVLLVQPYNYHHGLTMFYTIETVN